MTEPDTATLDDQHGGWRLFAGTIILLAGLFNVIDGLVAITNDHFLSNHLVVGSLSSWGWTFLILGIVQVLAAFLIFGGHALGAMIGVILAMLNALGQLLFLSSYPLWSTITIGLDLLIIYGLVAHGTIARRSR